MRGTVHRSRSNAIALASGGARRASSTTTTLGLGPSALGLVPSTFGLGNLQPSAFDIPAFAAFRHSRGEPRQRRETGPSHLRDAAFRNRDAPGLTDCANVRPGGHHGVGVDFALG